MATVPNYGAVLSSSSVPGGNVFLGTPNSSQAASPAFQQEVDIEKEVPKVDVSARQDPKAFLNAIFSEPSVVEYILSTAKPESAADFQLATSEAELHSWLPNLSQCQVRRLWSTLSTLPSERTPLLTDTESVLDSAEMVGRQKPLPNSQSVEPPTLPPPFGSFSRIWPPDQEGGGSSFLVERHQLFSNHLLWIDVCGTPFEMRPPEWVEDYTKYVEDLASVFRLHPASIKDCIAPGELPKVEFTEGVTFCVMRYCMEQLPFPLSDDVREISSKLVVIITTHPKSPETDVVISIHLKPLRRSAASAAFQGYYEMLVDGFAKDNPDMTKDHLVNTLFDDVLDTYELAMDKLGSEVDEYERRLIQRSNSDATKELYAARRQVSVFKRLLLMTQQSIQKYVRYVTHHGGHDPFTEDLQDTAKSLVFSIEDLYENTTELLNLHISLVSHRSNHFLYILTILSVLFMPITFIGAVYGMNFEGMPEVHWRFGYVYCLCLMLGAVLGTLGCLKWNGFIGGRQPHAVQEQL